MNLTLTYRTKVTPPSAADVVVSRYNWLSLDLAEPNLGIPPLSSALTKFWILTSDYTGFRGWAATESIANPLSSTERPDLGDLTDAVEELLYVIPQIRTFVLNNSASIYFAEYGTTIAPATLSWASNKVNPTAITTFLLLTSVNNTEFKLLSGNYTFTSLELVSLSASSLNQTYTFYVSAIDWANKVGSAAYTLKFVAPTFFGTFSSDELNLLPPTSAQILNGATSVVYNDNIKGNITVPTNDNSFFYAFPSGSVIPNFFFNNLPLELKEELNVNIVTPITNNIIPYTIKYSNNSYLEPITVLFT